MANFLQKNFSKIAVIVVLLFSANFAHAQATGGYTFINWTSGMTADFFANITGIISDLSPLLVPIIAVGVGLIVIETIISAVRGHK